jgi:hypothetical protein
MMHSGAGNMAKGGGRGCSVMMNSFCHETMQGLVIEEGKLRELKGR